MTIRPCRRLSRCAAALLAAAAVVSAPVASADAKIIILCFDLLRPELVYKWFMVEASWDCGQANGFYVRGCIDLSVQFVVPNTGGVGPVRPAFVVGARVGPVVPSPIGGPDTIIVAGATPRPDDFLGGSYSTTFFAVRQGTGPGGADQYAPLPVNLTGLTPGANRLMVSAVLGGELVLEPFGINPVGLIGTGDFTLVFQTVVGNDTVAIDTRLIPVSLSSLTFQNELPLPPTCAGDTNNSGGVSFADITGVLSSFGLSYAVGVLTPGDANGDRTVNFADVTTVLGNFGQICQ